MGLFGCLARVATVGLICLALFGGVLWYAGGRPAGAALSLLAVPTVASVASPVPAVAVAALTATPDSGSLASARGKLAAAMHTATAAPAGSHQVVTVTLSEAEVNAIAVPELQSEASFPLQQPALQILPGQVILTGQAAFGPTTLPVTVTGRVDLVNGVPTIVVTGVLASGITAPQSIVRQVSDQVAASVHLTPGDLPILVQQVALGNHTVTVSGVTK